MTKSNLSRRTIVGAGAGAAGLAALGGRAFAQTLALPKAPIELNFLDGAGNLILTQPILALFTLETSVGINANA